MRVKKFSSARVLRKFGEFMCPKIMASLNGSTMKTQTRRREEDLRQGKRKMYSQFRVRYVFFYSRTHTYISRRSPIYHSANLSLWINSQKRSLVSLEEKNNVLPLFPLLSRPPTPEKMKKSLCSRFSEGKKNIFSSPKKIVTEMRIKRRRREHQRDFRVYAFKWVKEKKSYANCASKAEEEEGFNTFLGCYEYDDDHAW